jgi:hypothetical protein
MILDKGNILRLQRSCVSPHLLWCIEVYNPFEDNTGVCGNVQGEFIVPLCAAAFYRKPASAGISVAAAVISDTLKSTL